MEQWKAIPGFEGIYEASNAGRIRTAAGKTTSNARYEKRVWAQRIMKPKLEKRKSGGNYDQRVCLWKDGKKSTVLVARMIALAWCAGYLPEYTVNHKDGNPLNNNAENLEWVSLRDNIEHAFENGLYSTQKQCLLVSPSGETLKFRSRAKASEFLGRCSGYIHNCIVHHREPRSQSGVQYMLLEQEGRGWNSLS